MKFGNTSQERLKTCHVDLQVIANTAIEVTKIDFGIAEGARSVERQKQLFDEGKSKIDGVTRKGKHNYTPSLAFDLYAFVNGKASWDREHLTYLGGMINGIAELLYQQGKITHQLRWGGNWDSDGVIISDQTFIDLPHFELI